MCVHSEGVDNTDGNGNCVSLCVCVSVCVCVCVCVCERCVFYVCVCVTDIRNEFKNYFLGKGQVPWQYRHVYVYII